MTWTVSTRETPNGVGLDPTLIVLEDGQGSVAEIWPALGFNCVRWSMVRNGKTLELLYRDPALFQGGRPTRSGIPILFPFPNRIRAGKYFWDGRKYQLPTNDPVQKNAIHGFACRVPWRIIDQGKDTNSAWVTGEFHCSKDSPESLALWPADHVMQLTIRLMTGTLRLEAKVLNPDDKELPFGLGYHPYFRLPAVGQGSADDCLVTVPARQYWALEENLPVGPRQAMDRSRNLDRPRRVGELQLDDVFTQLPEINPRADGLFERAAVHGDPEGPPMRLFCSPDFREMVVFTPPHRQAFCVEPYTCVTDAVNLDAVGFDAGWRFLPPGETWSSVVELSF